LTGTNGTLKSQERKNDLSPTTKACQNMAKTVSVGVVGKYETMLGWYDV